jgi:Ca2+-binding EF-hand superfamily protein
VFDLFDSDGSGTVDETELAAAMIALGLSDNSSRGGGIIDLAGGGGGGSGTGRAAAARLLDSVDKDHSRSVDLQEFSGLMQVAPEIDR